MARRYAISNQKGGVGKSTTVVNLASALAEKGKTILAVDIDPQAGLTTSMGFRPEEFEATVYNALIDDEFILERVITHTSVPNFDVIPSNLDLAAAEGELIGEIGWDHILKDALVSIESRYDFVLIDCPPSLGILTTNALMAAHRVIVPVQTEYLALRGLAHLQRVIARVQKKGNPGLHLRILRTLYDSRTLHAREVVEELDKAFGAAVYKTIIRRSIRFADSTLAGVPILQYDRNASGSEAYRHLAQEVLEDE